MFAMMSVAGGVSDLLVSSVGEQNRELNVDDFDGAALARPAIPRRVTYALVGAGLAQGVAAGLLLVRLIRRRKCSLSSLTREIGSDLGTYVYIVSSTTAVFSLFGGFVGRYADRLAQLATTDVVTGLLNARAFRQRLHEEMVRATRYLQPLSLLIMDMDDLKHLNDEYGHEAGDQALRRVGTAIRGGLREADLGARIGGDEFGVLAPNTNEAAAVVFGERLRASVAEGNRSAVQPGTTVSIGIASFAPTNRATTTEISLMRAADAALYRAKRDGGNRVTTS
jgi:diguanylate cyclase (GGDEF)-like protein